ncbi:MAG: hypothetical protein H0U01_08360 [Acidimicrobiia bacterium]|nr:hypothetical protein [Acidimicrobiia bacterium]
MSPRAAWRLESIGFEKVYDYVGSKMDWLGAGMPFEGTDADEPRLALLADPAVPTCSVDEPVDDVRGRVGGWEICVAVNAARVVLGLVRVEALSLADGRTVAEVMQEGPKTFRPHLTAIEVVPQLDETPRSWLLVTNLDGTLVGVARPDDVRSAAGSRGE